MTGKPHTLNLSYSRDIYGLALVDTGNLVKGNLCLVNSGE